MQFVIEVNHQGDISLIEEVVHLDYCLEMTPQQAFILFANNYIAFYGNLHNVDYEYFIRELKDKETPTFYFVEEYLTLK